MIGGQKLEHRGFLEFGIINQLRDSLVFFPFQIAV